MEEGQLRCGDITSADLKLWLTGPNDEKYQRNPVYLHSLILRRSEFFQVMMSERWSSGQSNELSVTISHNFNDYLKCIQLMYDEPVYFSNVEECLAILSVASELLVDVCIKKCMQYLEAVRWNAEEEIQIRNVLSSLGLKPFPDLSARLDKECVDHIIIVEKIIKQMISFIQGKQVTKNRENAEKYIRGIFERNMPRYVVELCMRELLQEFKTCIRVRNLSTISSIFQFFEHFDGETLKAAFIAFVEDSGFTKYVKRKLMCAEFKQFHELVIDTIIWFMKATGDGKLIISRASRNSFLTNWLPIMREMCYGKVEKLDELTKAVVNVFETLPHVDKVSICASWIELYEKHGMDISTPLTLFQDLHDVHYKLTSKQ